MNTLTAELELVRALPEDFKIYKGDIQGPNGNSIPSYKLLLGQLFFLKSQKTKKIDGPYRINESTDPNDLKIYLDAGMVYIPIVPPNSNIKIIKS